MSFLLFLPIVFVPQVLKQENTTREAKTLIIYFSKTGNTDFIANEIQRLVGGEKVRIETEIPYPDDYDETVAQAIQERDKKTTPVLKTRVPDFKRYDTLFIGFPVWKTEIPAPIRTLLTQYDFSGKTIIPFCTHKGFGPGDSFTTLQTLLPQSTILSGFGIEGEKRTDIQTSIEKWLSETGVMQSVKSLSPPLFHKRKRFHHLF